MGGNREQQERLASDAFAVVRRAVDLDAALTTAADLYAHRDELLALYEQGLELLRASLAQADEGSAASRALAQKVLRNHRAVDERAAELRRLECPYVDPFSPLWRPEMDEVAPVPAPAPVPSTSPFPPAPPQQPQPQQPQPTAQRAAVLAADVQRQQARAVLVDEVVEAQNAYRRARTPEERRIAYERLRSAMARKARASSGAGAGAGYGALPPRDTRPPPPTVATVPSFVDAIDHPQPGMFPHPPPLSPQNRQIPRTSGPVVNQKQQQQSSRPQQQSARQQQPSRQQQSARQQQPARQQPPKQQKDEDEEDKQRREELLRGIDKDLQEAILN